MNLERLVELTAADPVFEPGLLAATGESLPVIRVQLARWCSAGKVVQLRRGVYCLAAPYRRHEPHPFLIANRLSRGSLVSCESALQYWGLTPDAPWTVTSVTPGRTEQLETPLGTFVFRHVKRELLCGYENVVLNDGQEILVACPEKALLDLVHLTPGGEGESFLRELRLDPAVPLDEARLPDLARSARSPKLERACRRILRLLDREQE